LRRASITVAADNPTVIAGLPQAAEIAQCQLDVVIECDTGRKRAGVETRVQKLCDAAGVTNRPHIKTHKSPILAKMQAAAGAKGITCQKLGEAEVMVEGGLDDILISYNLLGAEKPELCMRCEESATAVAKDARFT